MGKIVPVIYKETDYKEEEIIKGYWFQNILDNSNAKEYKEFQLNQKRYRDKNIAEAQKELGIKGKVESALFASSAMNESVILVLETE